MLNLLKCEIGRQGPFVRRPISPTRNHVETFLSVHHWLWDGFFTRTPALECLVLDEKSSTVALAFESMQFPASGIEMETFAGLRLAKSGFERLAQVLVLDLLGWHPFEMSIVMDHPILYDWCEKNVSSMTNKSTFLMSATLQTLCLWGPGTQWKSRNFTTLWRHYCYHVTTSKAGKEWRRSVSWGRR